MVVVLVVLIVDWIQWRRVILAGSFGSSWEGGGEFGSIDFA